MIVNACPICGLYPDIEKLDKCWIVHSYHHQSHPFNVAGGARLDLGATGVTPEHAYLGWNECVTEFTEEGV